MLDLKNPFLRVISLFFTFGYFPRNQKSTFLCSIQRESKPANWSCCAGCYILARVEDTNKLPRNPNWEMGPQRGSSSIIHSSLLKSSFEAFSHQGGKDLQSGWILLALHHKVWDSTIQAFFNSTSFNNFFDAKTVGSKYFVCFFWRKTWRTVTSVWRRFLAGRVEVGAGSCGDSWEVWGGWQQPVDPPLPLSTIQSTSFRQYDLKSFLIAQCQCQCQCQYICAGWTLSTWSEHFVEEIFWWEMAAPPVLLTEELELELGRLENFDQW